MTLRRWSRFVLALLVLVPWVALASTQPAEAFPGEGIVTNIPCDALPGPVKLLCQGSSAAGGQGPIGADLGSATAEGTPGHALAGAVDCVTSPFDCFGKALAGTAGAIIDLTVKMVDSGTGPDLMRPEFVDRYARIMLVGLLLLAGKLIIKFARMAFSGSVGSAMRAVFLEVPAGLAAMAYLPAVLMFAMSFADALTTLVTLGTKDEVKAWLQSLGTNIAKVPLPGGGFTLILVAGLLLLGGLALFFEAVLRSSLIYAAALFGPIGVTNVAEMDHERQRSHKFLSFILVLIMAQPLVFGVLALGAALLTTNTFEGVMSGLGLLFVAIFAVGMLFAWVPGQVEGVMHATQARQKAQGMAKQATPSQSQMLRSGSQAHSRGGNRSGGGTGAPSYAAREGAKVGSSGSPWIDAGYRGGQQAAKKATSPIAHGAHGAQDWSNATSGRSGGGRAETWSGTDPWQTPRRQAQRSAR